MRRVVLYEDDEIIVEAVYVDDEFEVVLRALRERPMTYREVVEKTPLSWKRVQYVLARLVALGLVCVEKGVYSICGDANDFSRSGVSRGR